MASPAVFISSGQHVPKRLVASYLLDWLMVIVIAAGGGALYLIRGSHHPFSLDDISISYPLKSNTVSITVVGIVAFLTPAFITAILSLFLVRETSISKRVSKSVIWRRKLWEWNVAWLGLGMSLAGTLLVTSALKDIVGKPRPNLIARCNPDLSNINAHIVSGLGTIREESPILVDIGICQNSDHRTLLDGFASFPSGHSSFSFAGLFYLTLWICAKLATAIPSSTPNHHRQISRANSERSYSPNIPTRNKAAAPPIYLFLVAFAPTAAAIYICATRWSDNQHHGFDIVTGALIGAFFAWLGFRWYHPPLHDGRWSWAPRAWDQAFYASPGTNGFARDLEYGNIGSEFGQGDVLRAQRNNDHGIELGPFQRD